MTAETRQNSRTAPSSSSTGEAVSAEIRRDPAGDRESAPAGTTRLDTDSDLQRARAEQAAINPAAEDAWWEANHDLQSYADIGEYADFAAAYRTGYEGFERLGTEYTFDEVEEELEEAYELEGSDLMWDEARDAAKAAWDRAATRA